MAWSKLQIIRAAYGELALADHDFDISPEEDQAALMKLEAMMATWQAKGVSIGYAFGTADASQASGLPLIANEAVYLGLATRVAASKGKALPPSSIAAASDAYRSLISSVAADQARQMQLPAGTPLGAGNRPWRRTMRPFVSRPDTSPVRLDDDTGLDLGG